MNLNNHGWGLRDMIIYTCILLIFLLIAVFSVNMLYDSLSENKKDNKQQDVVNEPTEEQKPPVVILDYEYYKKEEYRFWNATLEYLNKTKPDLTKKIEKITAQELVDKGYMNELYDQNGNRTCTGYSNAYQDSDGDYVVKSYITCSNYNTEGY